MTTLQKTIIGTTLIAAFGTGIYEARQALRLREQNQTLQQRQAPLIAQTQGLLKERGGHEKALADFTRCLELRPNDLSARWNRANAYAQLREYDNAIADWTTLIEGDTDYSRQVEGKTKTMAREYFWRGQVYQNYKHDYSKAIADYTAALQLDPNTEWARRTRGECFEKIGETEKAQQDFAVEPKRN